MAATGSGCRTTRRHCASALQQTIADLTVVKSQTVTLDDPGSAAASFAVRVTLTDGTMWQARVPVAAMGQATEAELRLWALRLAGKVAH